MDRIIVDEKALSALGVDARNCANRLYEDHGKYMGSLESVFCHKQIIGFVSDSNDVWVDMHAKAFEESVAYMQENIHELANNVNEISNEAQGKLGAYEAMKHIDI